MNEKKKTYTVYKHTSPSGKVYIGITYREPNERWQNGRGYKGQIFYNAIQKYGWDKIQHEILATRLTKEEAEKMEIKLIADYKSNDSRYGYNVQNGGSSIGKHSEKSKEKISKNHANVSGKNNPMYGIKRELSEETKQKISNAGKGKLIYGKNPMAKQVFCDGRIYSCVKEFSEKFNVPIASLYDWLRGRSPMPIEWYVLGLSYLNSDIKIKHKQLKRKIRSDAKMINCDNKIYTVKQLSELLNVAESTIKRWLKNNKIPKRFKHLNLYYV
jgi:hypothetical protein